MHYLRYDILILTALPASSLAYSSTLKTEATCSFETTRRYIPGETTLRRITPLTCTLTLS
jgi:hypothetical protein